MGDATRIRRFAPRKQKTDVRDTDHLLELLERDQFPAIWVPSGGGRDLRELVQHRHKLVQMRTRIKNQLQHVALNEGLQKQRQLWTKAGRQWLQQLALPEWTARRRQDLLHFLEPARQQDRRTGPGCGRVRRAGYEGAPAADPSPAWIASAALLGSAFVPPFANWREPIGVACIVMSAVLGLLAAQLGSKCWLVIPTLIGLGFAAGIFLGFHSF